MFADQVGTNPRVYRAPGRVNLIGEHTDYNEGFVMPAAIGFDCWVAAGPREDRKLVICSEEFPGITEVELSWPETRPRKMWSDYVVGVALELEKAEFRLRGTNIFIHGEVPIGAGLSSSAAIEVATALALAEQSGRSPDRMQLALLCQKAENDFVGAHCGIMDQFISLHGRKNHAVMLDCRSLRFELVSVPDSVRLVICNTMVKHDLASSGYNQRRAECEEAIRRLAEVLPGVRSLRDVAVEQLEAHRGALSETLYKRSFHVITENARVLKGAEALRSGNVQRFGESMAASHRSLRDFYEASSEELDLMVELANQQEGVYGARMTGGGFGGSTINLVEACCADEFMEKMARAYQEKTGIAPQIHICAPAEGAGAVASAGLQEWAGQE
jgi:galactokinase